MPNQWTRLYQIKSSFFHNITSYKILKCSINKPNEEHNQSINQSVNQSINQSFYMNNVTSLRDETISRYLFYEEVLKDKIA